MATLSHFSHNIANKHIRRCMATLSSSWSTCCYKCSSASTTGQASRTENFAENMGCYMRLVVQNSFNHRGSLVAHSIPLCPVNFSVGKRRKRALAYENDKQSALGFVLCSTANTTRQMSRRLHTLIIQRCFTEPRQSPRTSGGSLHPALSGRFVRWRAIRDGSWRLKTTSRVVHH